MNIFQDNTAIGYTFPSVASDYTITVDFTVPLIVDGFGILPGIGGTNVGNFSVQLDQEPEFPEYSGPAGSILLTNASDTAKSSRITFDITNTTNGLPPTNIIIYIQGCNQTTLSTKAQIELRGTTVQAG